MPASSCRKLTPSNDCGRPGVARRLLVAWAKLFALSLSLFLYLPVVVPLLLLARTRTGQLMAILVTLLASGAVIPDLQREVPTPGLHEPQTATRGTVAPAEDPAKVAGLREPAKESAINTTWPSEQREVDLFAAPADRP